MLQVTKVCIRSVLLSQGESPQAAGLSLTEQGPDTACESGGGRFDVGGYSTEVIYSSSTGGQERRKRV